MCLPTPTHLIQGDWLLAAALRHDGEIMQVFQQTLVLGERQDHTRLSSCLVHDIPLTQSSHRSFHVVYSPHNPTPPALKAG